MFKLNQIEMLKKIFFTGFFGWIFFYILIYIKPELHFHAQQPAFLNTRLFFMENLRYPGGFGKYIANFLMQGFYFNWLGSLIILFFATSLSLLLYLILNRLNLNKSLAVLILPFSIAIVLFNDYYFPFEILIHSVFIFLSVYLFIHLFKFQRLIVPGFLLLYIFLYYMSGSGPALVFSLSCLLVYYQRMPVKAFLWHVLSVVTVSVFFPFFAYSFLFNLSYSQAFFQFLPSVPVTLLYFQSVLLYLFVFLLPVLIFIDIFVTKAGNSKTWLLEKTSEIAARKNGLTGQLILFLFLIVCMTGLINYTKDKHKRNVVLSDFYSFQSKWDKVIDVALSDTIYDFSVNLSYNRAIDYSGKFLQNFFDYPQMLGVSSLFPDNLKTPFYSVQISDYYFDINYISKSLQWAHEAKTLEPYNPRVLKRLVITNLILGNYKAAHTYLNVLSKNPLSSDFVLQYLPYITDSTRITNDPILSRKRSLQPVNFTIPLNINDRLTDLISHDSLNRQAFEHLQICRLLEHDLGKFMSQFDASIKFYNRIPAVYEEAVILYLYSAGKNSSRINISGNTKNQLSYFLKTLNQHGNDAKQARNSLAGIKNTYMYYVTYLSPRVTNLSVETTKKN